MGFMVTDETDERKKVYERMEQDTRWKDKSETDMA